MIVPEIFDPYLDEVFVGFEGSLENFSQAIPGEKRGDIFQKFLEKQDIHDTVELILDPLQTHSKTIFSDENYSEKMGCDGVCTDKKDVLCVIKTADCIGAIFYNPELKVGATIHAGWRGLSKKIFSAFLQKFSFHDQKNFLVALSPSLGKCCAEFSDPYHETPEFFYPFVEKRSEFSGEYAERYFVDLWGIAQHELQEIGIPEKNIQMPACCTKCGGDISGKKYPQKFWSHRNGDRERNGTFFMRKK